tara:strand:+ start:144367 stop:145686 length:1320 start_codon:yes stop_codon:yes gene_type:complete
LKARIRQFFDELGETFWLVPAAMVSAGILIALLLLYVDRIGLVPTWLLESDWLYNGGVTGARTLLGTVAASTIGVAGTVFSITIAALSLAAGQMGPRLLRNFTRDRGNQVTLGAFLGTFCYSLMVLRSVRTQDEGVFIPHIALAFGMLLALACVATLVYFVGHMASRINVDTVIELVSGDIRVAMRGLLTDKQQVDAPDPHFWKNATPIVDARCGYLQQLDEEGLADWACRHGTAIRLLARRGDYISPGTPIAVMTAHVADAETAIHNATALGASRGSAGDAEHAIRQLVEVAVRALSPGINDPHTAMSVLDRLGAVLCEMAGSQLPTGVWVREEKIVLVVPNISYESLVAVMFHMIRQNAGGSTSVIIKMLDVLSVAMSCENDEKRRAVLLHHGDLVWQDAQNTIENQDDLEDVQKRRKILQRMMEYGVLGAISAVGI